jgi:hypothetical protein
MKLVSIVLLVLAGALEVFAYWGLFTASGMRVFDEMAGLFPFFAGLAGAGLALCGALLWWIARRRARRRSSPR